MANLFKKRFSYRIVSGTFAEITKYNGVGEEVTIPSELGGYPVESIGKSAFCFFQSLEEIIIPDSVKSIGEEAFVSCKMMNRLKIGNGVVSIGKAAFELCWSLAAVDIPGNVKSIADRAFLCCISLATVNISESVTEIGDSAFEFCANLRSIFIPDSVTHIGDDAFAHCDKTVRTSHSLTNCVGIDFPDTVEHFKFEIHCHAGSYAETYAKKNEIDFCII